MSDRPSSGGREPESSAESSSTTAERDAAPESVAAEVDDEVQRRLREAYLNDAERELVVTGVRSAGDEVVVAFQTPHGDATHTERFPAPRNGSLTESEAFLAFLETAGVSPLDVDELVGTRVPATYDPETGWRVDAAYRTESGEGSRFADARDWLWTYRAWLLAALLVGGELAFVAVIILVYA